MALLQIHRVEAESYRCFAALDLVLEPDLTVLFAENGGGKTLALRAIAALLSAWLPRVPPALWSAGREKPDLRQLRTPAGAWEPAGPAALRATATVGGAPTRWHLDLRPDDLRVRHGGLSELSAARKRVKVAGAPWPLLGWYGTQRLWAGVKQTAKRRVDGPVHREHGYVDCLDPRATERATLDWLHRECVGDALARLDGRPQRGFADAVFAAMRRATPGLRSLTYDYARREVVAELERGGAVPWSQLSDGYHVFLGLIGDVARRAVLLNDHLGPAAVAEAEGVVLVDEVDLHLHPVWQERVVDGLRAAFPRVQWVLTTHSALVLSGAENRQVRHLHGFQVQPGALHVRGRDVGSILRESLGGPVRAAWGQAQVDALATAVERGDAAGARALMRALEPVWGPSDPELAWAAGFLGPEDEGGA